MSEHRGVKILSVVGARPQFVKLAAVHRAMQADSSLEHVIVHTGQHYDANMSDVFFDQLGIGRPHENLEIGSGSHGQQTGAMLAGMDAVLERHAPDMVLVYGDTNSTLAGTLAAVKMHIPVAHLEAGLRSFNRRMPEEHNRVLTDHAADLLLPPTHVALEHLMREGLAERAIVVGDVMTDICYRTRDDVLAQPEPLPTGIRGDFLVATIHRADNTDDRETLAAIVTALHSLPQQVLLVAHPRLIAKAEGHGITLEQGSIVLCEPLAYHQLVSLVLQSAGVVTDSGGLQKEAYLLGRPCTTLRGETEWVETLEGGWNVLAQPTDDIAALVTRPAPSAARQDYYGTGDAAERTVAALREFVATRG
ncbi:UDP-N-acetylglucosamine 2-epimerase (non-hydrolyzing) [Micrococcales bacterium 31B]|nr:UDP-N-acetylglucosamine 2-epimerase (non-hydrolyzing) [Micrococcales bacterium 31B]